MWQSIAIEMIKQQADINENRRERRNEQKLTEEVSNENRNK